MVNPMVTAEQTEVLESLKVHCRSKFLDPMGLQWAVFGQPSLGSVFPMPHAN